VTPDDPDVLVCRRCGTTRYASAKIERRRRMTSQGATG
jgi:hypothetical protein